MTTDSGRLRLSLVGLVAAALFAAMFARLWYLQVLQSPSFKAQAVSDTVRVIYDPAPRGLILDRQGKVLVGNQVVEEVTLAHRTLPTSPVIPRLAAVLGMIPADIQSRLGDARFSLYQPVPVQVGTTPDQVIFLREHQGDFPGVSVQLTTQRTYPFGSLAAQVLGYVGQISKSQVTARKTHGYRPGDLVGQDGIEQAYEPFLRGTPGERSLEVDVKGRVVRTLSVRPPVPGDNVQLSIDAGVQANTEASLKNTLLATQGTHDPVTHQSLSAPAGSSVVMDPNNGSVLAMASYPTYDPKVWVGGISSAEYKSLSTPAGYYPLDNRAILGEYAPGSTFKLATATAGVQRGLITPNTYINDPGYYAINNGNCAGTGCRPHNSFSGGLGGISLQEAITASDDVYFYTLGGRFWQQRAKYGQTPIQDTAMAYGLGITTGVDLPGATTGAIASPANRQALYKAHPKDYLTGSWYEGDNVNMAIGQGETAVTPLQLALAYSTFANGGTRYQPEIGARILTPTGKVVSVVAPKATGHVALAPDLQQTLLAGFEGATKARNGTATTSFAHFDQTNFNVAGKTGTADVSGGKPPTSLFVAFAPAQAPRYVVDSVLEQAGFGADAAAPVAREVLQYLKDHPVGPLQAPTPQQ